MSVETFQIVGTILGFVFTALVAIDGIFGGGERLLAIYTFVIPPRNDASVLLSYRAMGYRADSFEKTGKAAFQIGFYLVNQSSVPLHFKVERARYTLYDMQNAPNGTDVVEGIVFPGKTQPVDLPPIYWKFSPPIVYHGDALIIVKYGKKKGRLGNTLRIHGALRWEPGAEKARRFAYAWYPDSNVPSDPVVDLEVIPIKQRD